jgi:hypothetical protein
VGHQGGWQRGLRSGVQWGVVDRGWNHDSCSERALTAVNRAALGSSQASYACRSSGMRQRLHLMLLRWLYGGNPALPFLPSLYPAPPPPQPHVPPHLRPCMLCASCRGLCCAPCCANRSPANRVLVERSHRNPVPHLQQGSSTSSSSSGGEGARG